MTRAVWLAFTPRDTVMVRDGRRFDAGVDVTAETTRPWPSTMGGAVGAAYGREVAELRAPVLARRSRERWTPYFPAPADLVLRQPGAMRVTRLRSASTPVVTDLSSAVPQWLQGVGEPLGGWLPATTLERYLHGALLDGRDGAPVGDLRRVEDPLEPERRVGLARTDNRTARTGFLYQTTHLRLREGWGLLAECVLPDGPNGGPASTVPLGGQTRLADVTHAVEVGWPAPPAGYPAGRVLVYLATPALWPAGWRIPVPPGAQLVAAAVGEPESVATATPGPRFLGTRALRWAVPAGSVYLLQFDSGEQARSWAASAHGRAYGRAQDDRLRTTGFGVVLTGVWP